MLELAAVVGAPRVVLRALKALEARGRVRQSFPDRTGAALWSLVTKRPSPREA